MRILECMADAIQHYEGWHPGSVSCRNNNPGNLRHSPLQRAVDDRGYAIFVDYETGRRALLNDLEAKVYGHSKYLNTGSTLQDLFDVYAPRADQNEPSRYAEFVAEWLTRGVGLERNMIYTVDTPLQTLQESAVIIDPEITAMGGQP